MNTNVILESDVTLDSKLELFEFADGYVLRVDGKPSEAALVAMGDDRFELARKIYRHSVQNNLTHVQGSRRRLHVNRIMTKYKKAIVYCYMPTEVDGLYYFVVKNGKKITVNISKCVNHRTLWYTTINTRTKNECRLFQLELLNGTHFDLPTKQSTAPNIDEIFEPDEDIEEVVEENKTEDKTEQSIPVEINNQFLVKTFLDIKTHFESNNMTSDSRRNFVALLTKMLD